MILITKSLTLIMESGMTTPKMPDLILIMMTQIMMKIMIIMTIMTNLKSLMRMSMINYLTKMKRSQILMRNFLMMTKVRN